MNFCLSNICVTLQCQMFLVWPQMEAVIVDAFMSSYSFLHQKNGRTLLKYHWTLVSEFQYSVNAFTWNATEVWHDVMCWAIRRTLFLFPAKRNDFWYCWMSLLCTVLSLWTARHMDINTHVASIQQNAAAVQIPVSARTKGIVSALTWRCHMCAEELFTAWQFNLMCHFYNGNYSLCSWMRDAELPDNLKNTSGWC